MKSHTIVYTICLYELLNIQINAQIIVSSINFLNK